MPVNFPTCIPHVVSTEVFVNTADELYRALTTTERLMDVFDVVLPICPHHPWQINSMFIKLDILTNASFWVL